MGRLFNEKQDAKEARKAEAVKVKKEKDDAAAIPDGFVKGVNKKKTFDTDAGDDDQVDVKVESDIDQTIKKVDNKLKTLEKKKKKAEKKEKAEKEKKELDPKKLKKIQKEKERRDRRKRKREAEEKVKPEKSVVDFTEEDEEEKNCAAAEEKQKEEVRQ